MKKLIFLGDSITDCDRLWDVRPEPLGSGYVRVIRENLSRERYHLINRGHNGYTAWQVQRSLGEDCLSGKPDVVSLLVGINDVCARLWNAGGYDAREYGEILEEIADSVRSSTGAEMILMEPFLFPWPQEMLTWVPTLEEFQEAACRAARRTGTAYLRLAGRWRRAGEELGVRNLTVDGIHLTQKGHEILAAEWMKFAKECKFL